MVLGAGVLAAAGVLSVLAGVEDVALLSSIFFSEPPEDDPRLSVL